MHLQRQLVWAACVALCLLGSGCEQEPAAPDTSQVGEELLASRLGEMHNRALAAIAMRAGDKRGAFTDPEAYLDLVTEAAAAELQDWQVDPVVIRCLASKTLETVLEFHRDHVLDLRHMTIADDDLLWATMVSRGFMTARDVEAVTREVAKVRGEVGSDARANQYDAGSLMCASALDIFRHSHEYWHSDKRPDRDDLIFALYDLSGAFQGGFWGLVWGGPLGALIGEFVGAVTVSAICYFAPPSFSECEIGDS